MIRDIRRPAAPVAAPPLPALLPASLLSVVLALALVGCGTGGSEGDDAVDTGQPAGSADAGDAPGRGCPVPDPDTAALPPPPAGPRPDRPAEVLTCTVETRPRPDGSQWLVLVERRGDAGVATLVAALALPSEPPSAAPCTAIAVELPWFAFVAGESVGAPPVPTDPCGRPRPEVLAALDSLDLPEVAVTDVRDVTPTGAAGCSTDWKHTVAIEGPTAATGGPGPSLGGPVRTLRICVYDAPPGRDRAVPVGTLRTGSELAGAEAAALTAALDAAGPAAPCDSASTAFATVVADGGPNPAYVELDGCYRLLAVDGTLRQLDATVVPLLGPL